MDKIEVEQSIALAMEVRDRCIETALQAYENAAISGLCCEGAWEAAISSIKMLESESLLANLPSTDN